MMKHGMELRARKRARLGEAVAPSDSDGIQSGSDSESELGHELAPLQISALSGSNDVIAQLQAISSVEERYEAQFNTLSMMLQYHERASTMIEEVYQYIENDGAWKCRHQTKQEFYVQWGEARIIIVQNAERRNRLEEAVKKMGSIWSAEAAHWLVQVNDAANFIAAARTLAIEYPRLEDATKRVNRVVIDRLSSRRKGVSTQKRLQAADFSRAKGSDTAKEVSLEELARHGLRIGVCGFVEEGAALLAVGTGSSGGGGEASDFPSPAWEIESAPATPSDDAYGFQDEGIDEEEMEEINLELERITRDTGEDMVEGLEKAKCGCSLDVTNAWKKNVSKRQSFEAGPSLRLLRQMFEGDWEVCWEHMKGMGAHMGLRIKQLNGETLPERLRYIFEHRNELGRLKTDKDTFSWFRVANRPPRPSDKLGPYKFTPRQVGPKAPFKCDQQMLAEWLGIDVETWEQEGSVNFDLFSWWWGCKIGEIVELEYQCMRWHLRKINGKENYGWLRNCFYCIGQQLMRQDPMYYAAYCALRPDQKWRLVSYPYYAKYAVKGDQTYFRHIDLNIPDLIANARGAGMIQGSLSLDNETTAGSTVILPGMHLPGKLQAWWDLCKARGQGTNGFVHRIDESMFTKDDAKALGTDWKRVPCKRGEVRVTMPHLPHGADGPTEVERKTMLPWYVDVQDDHSTLEVVEGGTWEMLSTAHRDMVSPRATPSGLANRYGAIPYRFPATVEVANLSALSDALVCRRRWDSPLVLRDRNTMLTGPRAEAAAYVQRWRAKAEQVAVEAFELAVAEDKRVFGDASFYFHYERMRDQGIPMPDLEPDEDFDDEEESGGKFAEAPDV